MVTSSILPFDQRRDFRVDIRQRIIVEPDTSNSFRVQAVAFLVWTYSGYSLNRE
jgi:hypothetical protein